MTIKLPLLMKFLKNHHKINLDQMPTSLEKRDCKPIRTRSLIPFHLLNQTPNSSSIKGLSKKKVIFCSSILLVDDIDLQIAIRKGVRPSVKLPISNMYCTIHCLLHIVLLQLLCVPFHFLIVC